LPSGAQAEAQVVAAFQPRLFRLQGIETGGGLIGRVDVACCRSVPSFRAVTRVPPGNLLTVVRG